MIYVVGTLLLLLLKTDKSACLLFRSSAKNTPHAGGYAARYNATAGFFKIPETEVSLSNGGLVQNEGWTDASSEYSGW